jgi:enoyl-CoA hydratase/carnithine racemase
LSRPFTIEPLNGGRLLRLTSADGMNRLTHSCLLAFDRDGPRTGKPRSAIDHCGKFKLFLRGCGLNEISRLSGPEAYESSKIGQTLMNEIEHFPAPVYAVVSGHCMGGGLDLALACHRRFAAPQALLGQRGAALGLVTGWGGTQRLPRLTGMSRALEMFVAAERITAEQALRMGMAEVVCPLPEK